MSDSIALRVTSYVLTGMGGFAIGAAQTWIRDRVEHRRQLRRLLAELRRLKSFDAKWPDLFSPTPPTTNYAAAVPTVTPTYLPLVSSIDFYPTDEHLDDNSQWSLMNLADGCRQLGEVQSRIMPEFQRVTGRGIESKTTPDELRDLVEMTEVYNAKYDTWQESLLSAIGDIERRLRQSRWRWQLARLFVWNPANHAGTNPPAIRPRESGRD